MQRREATRARRVLIGLTYAAVVPTAAFGALPSLAAPANRHHHHHHRHWEHRFMLCKPFRVGAISGPWGSYAVRNAVFWPGLGNRRSLVCLKHGGGHPSFLITRSNANPPAGSEPAAYSEIFYGCVHSACTRGSRLPQNVRRLSNIRISTYDRLTRHARGGTWDASFDIWFSKHHRMSGQPSGAELMIWLSNRGVRYSPRSIIRVSGFRWLAEEWQTHNSKGVTWPLIIFERFHQSNHVKQLPLGPFIRFSERRHWIKPRYWLESIASGFEIWRRGRGLGINFMRVVP